MPAAIPLVVVAASAAATAASAAGIIAVSTAALIGVGLSVAGTLASVIFAPQPPKPKFADGKQTVKQAVPPRARCYGRYRLGGSYVWYKARGGGTLEVLLCHAAHQIDAVEEHWLNDELVETVPKPLHDGYDQAVITPPYAKFRPGTDNSSVNLRNYLGTPGQTVVMPPVEWTAAHRARGLACTFVAYGDLKAEQQQEVFPNGPPAYNATLRGAKVYIPGTSTPGDESTYLWSDNAALVILDYLTRAESGVPVGFGLDLATQIDVASFAAAAPICDQVIPRKTHEPPYPDEKRWRAWGAYDLTEDRKTVLADLLDACGGRLIQRPDGKLGLTVGTPNPVAAVTINDDQVLEYDFSAGKAAIERVNEVRASYVSQEQDWAETEAGIQLDQASIERNGAESSAVKLRFVPSEGQAQRVARSILKRGNPNWAGRIRGTLALLDAWGERWVRLQLAELDIDQVFEISSMRIDRTTMSVEMEVTSYDGWWDWNPETDEADPAPIPDDGDDEEDMPVPENVEVVIEHQAVNGQNLVAVGVITWDPPARSVFVGQARYRLKVPADSPWILLSAEQDTNLVRTLPLTDGQVYQAQARFLGPRRTASDWAPLDPPDGAGPVEFTAVADPVAPAQPIGLTAQANTPGTGQVTVSATQANDPRAATLRFYRNSSNTFVGATLLSGMPLYVGPGESRSVVETPGAGDWWYFATSSNWSNVASAAAGGVLAEVSPATIVILSPAPPGPVSTYDRRQPVSGSGAAAGAPIKLYSNGVQVGTSTAAGDGTWSVTPSSDLAIGADIMTATQTVGGNESLPSGAVTLNVVAIDADAWSYIVAMTVRPDFTRQTLIKDLVDSIKAAGLWTKLDRLYLLAAHHEQASRLNIRAPATDTLVATTANSTAPTFTTDRGWQGAGAGTTVGGYLAAAFNATVGTNQFLQDSAHLMVWMHLASSGTVTGDYRDAGGGLAAIATKNATAVLYCLANAGAADTPAQSGDGTGFYAWSRQAAANYHGYQDTNDLGTTSRTSAALASGAFGVLRAGARYSNGRAAAAGWGAGLNSTEMTDYRNALHTYLVGIGAAV